MTTAGLPNTDTSPVRAPMRKASAKRPRELVGVTKTCGKCGVCQDLSEFAIKREGRAAQCRSCQKLFSDAHYMAHKEARVQEAGVRNKAARSRLADIRKSYLAGCICEECSSTVDLQLTTRAGYTGLSPHEVVAGAYNALHMADAISHGRVLCKPCMGAHYGHIGGTAKAARRVAGSGALF